MYKSHCFAKTRTDPIFEIHCSGSLCLQWTYHKTWKRKAAVRSRSNREHLSLAVNGAELELTAHRLRVCPIRSGLLPLSSIWKTQEFYGYKIELLVQLVGILFFLGIRSPYGGKQVFVVAVSAWRRVEPRQLVCSRPWYRATGVRGIFLFVHKGRNRLYVHILAVFLKNCCTEKLFISPFGDVTNLVI